jgi:hypothetical protein
MLSDLDSALLWEPGWPDGRCDDVTGVTGVDPPVLTLCLVVPLDKVVEFPEVEDNLVEEAPGVVEEFLEVEEGLVVGEVIETVDELVSVEDTVPVELEEAAEELVATVQFGMGMDITLTPESVPLLDTSTSVQASPRKICVV